MLCLDGVMDGVMSDSRWLRSLMNSLHDNVEH